MTDVPRPVPAFSVADPGKLTYSHYDRYNRIAKLKLAWSYAASGELAERSKIHIEKHTNAKLMSTMHLSVPFISLHVSSCRWKWCDTWPARPAVWQGIFQTFSVWKLLSSSLAAKGQWGEITRHTALKSGSEEIITSYYNHLTVTERSLWYLSWCLSLKIV